MKIILLVLSGDSDRAREIVQAYYPSSHIELFPRIELENRGIVAGLARVRKLRLTRKPLTTKNALTPIEPDVSVPSRRVMGFVVSANSFFHSKTFGPRSCSGSLGAVIVPRLSSLVQRRRLD